MISDQMTHFSTAYEYECELLRSVVTLLKYDGRANAFMVEYYFR